MSTDFAVEKKSLRNELLFLMLDCKWHDARMLHMVAGVRYSARLLELKRLGYVFESKGEDKEGKLYRLTSKEPLAPQGKRVKVFLSAEDAGAILAWSSLPHSARMSLSGALISFNNNRNKL